MYTARDAIKTFHSYMNITHSEIKIIPKTENRGFVFNLNSIEKCVIFLYPIGHKSDNSKNYFDTRDSGGSYRIEAYNFACKNNLKFFVLGVHDQIDKYRDYIFSLECSEENIRQIDGTVNGRRGSIGTQIVIPNSLIPAKSFERITTKLGVYLAVIHKNVIRQYLEFFDNRPYQYNYTNNNKNIVNNIDNVDFVFFSIKKINNKYQKQYITSLLAKPFVILTGNSGTGKTRIARRFAEYLKKESESGESNILIVPVGADWTDNTKILGYFNPLADDGAGVYVKTEIFRFLERANANPQIPFFLILDEMNLSHVERYFSDFLSKMEIPGSVFEIDGYGTLPYPKNLFVTGTVNIDETTYMFSPKVLDRANVIEFKPEKDSVLTSLTAEMKEESLAAEPGMAEGFLQLAEKIRNAPATDYNNIGFTAAEPILSELYDILQKAGFEFAFRTVKEIRQYLIAAYELEEEKENFSLNGHLDIQILQKILPKIYGNRQQVGALLEELKAFFEKENFTHSLQKVTQMAERLSRFQFVSFV